MPAANENMTKTATETDTRAAGVAAFLSAAILRLESEGADLSAAIDQVLGAGTYSRIAGETYDALRARAR